MRSTADKRDSEHDAAPLAAAKRALSLAVIFAICGAEITIAQEHPSLPSSSFYIGGSFSDNLSTASIDAYDGSSYCGTFRSGKHNAFSPLAGLNVPIAPQWSLGGKFQYSNLSTNFDIPVISNNPPSAYNPTTRQYVQVERRRQFDANLGLASVSALLSYNLFPHFSLSAGPFAGVFVQHSYAETEYIVNSPGAIYPETRLTTRPISDGQIPNMHTLLGGIEYGVSYEIPFQPHLWLLPSVGGMLQLTRSISDKSTGPWRVNPLAASLSLVYRASEPPQPVMPKPPLFAVDTLLTVPHPPLPEPPRKRSVLRISIKAFGVQDDGTETPEPILSIERMHVTEVYPMLHYVFFDDGSSVIPARYNHETLQSKKQFSEKAFYTASALDIHHHILDILGSRLTENPHATITLVGTRSTHSPLDSASGTEVSAGRAEAAAKYLRDVWGIANARLHIRSRDLPEAPSDDRNPFGEAENRRVEIVPSSPEIIAPLWTERIERVATPPHIDFTPEIVTSAGIRSATIIVKQRDCILQTFDALTGGSTGEYIWTLGGSSMPGRSDSLTYTFDVIDSLGDSASANGVIHLRQETHDISKHTSDTSLDKDLERYSLILFDYSSSQLDKKQSERILRDMASAIREASQVTLTGHTDRTGDDAFNYRLARQRVSRAGEMLSEELRRMGKERPAMVVESHGSRDLLFDNGIPEGRVLSRTVRALIENEIK